LFQHSTQTRLTKCCSNEHEQFEKRARRLGGEHGLVRDLVWSPLYIITQFCQLFKNMT